MSKGRTLIVGSLLVLSLLAFPVGATSAQECSLDPASLEPLIDVYNQNVDQAPAIARGQLAGEHIDLRIDTAAGERRYDTTTDTDGRITAFEESTAEDPTLRVETDESTVCGVLTSQDPAAAFKQAYQDGSIDVSGVGTVNGVKVEAVKVGIGVADWLSGLF